MQRQIKAALIIPGVPVAMYADLDKDLPACATEAQAREARDAVVHAYRHLLPAFFNFLEGWSS